MFRTLKPEKVYVTEDVYEDDRAAACAERLMTAIDGTEAERVSYEELNEIVPKRWARFMDRGWHWGAEPNPTDPDLVMTTGKFWPDEKKEKFRELYPNLGFRDLRGFTVKTWREDGEMSFRRERRGFWGNRYQPIVKTHNGNTNTFRGNRAQTRLQLVGENGCHL